MKNIGLKLLSINVAIKFPALGVFAQLKPVYGIPVRLARRGSKFCLFLSCVIFASEIRATILAVPDSFSTIESAFDVLVDGDTVLVRPQIYAEALEAPPLFFYLLGNINRDSINYARPVLNPSSLPNSNSLSCLIVPQGGSIVIEDFAFINGPEMFPRVDDAIPGGIHNYSSSYVTLRRCNFDSVYWGIDYGFPNVPNRIVLDSCNFFDMTGTCAYSRGSLVARHCSVSGSSYAGMAGLDSVIIEDCSFTGNFELGCAGIFRGNSVIRNCQFGQATCWTSLGLSSHSGNITLENCMFISLNTYSSLLDIGFLDNGGNNVLRNCVFAQDSTAGAGQSSSIHFQEDFGVDELSMRMIIANNYFENCVLADDSLTLSKLIWMRLAYSQILIQQNYFLNNRPLTGPAIYSDTLGNLHAIHDNIFLNNGYAVQSLWQTLDARFNYWGDSTGPYHPALNPDGLGDAVSDLVIFDPWYTDTLFMNPSGQVSPIPNDLNFNVFPNPFNSEFQVRLPSFVNSIAVFDLTGRTIKKFSTPFLSHPSSIHVAMHGFPSGIYFISLDSEPSFPPQKVVLLR